MSEHSTTSCIMHSTHSVRWSMDHGWRVQYQSPINHMRVGFTQQMYEINAHTHRTCCVQSRTNTKHKKKNTYSDNIHKRCLARILQSDQCQFHFLLPEQALEPIQYSIYHRNHFGCGFFSCLFLLMPNRMYNSKGSMPRTHTIRLTLTDVCSNDTI